MAERTKVLIMGAAGRDFHNFNTYFRDKQEYEIVAFTATQIPYINDRKYPAELGGGRTTRTASRSTTSPRCPSWSRSTASSWSSSPTRTCPTSTSCTARPW